MIKRYLFSFSFISLLTMGCTKMDDDPITSNEDVFSSEQLTNAANYSQEKGGTSVLIMEKGSIVFEDYHNGADQHTATHIHSATKLFWASVAALAKQNQLLDYDEYVANTITEWQDSSVHPGKDQIKIKHLLTLSSGLSQNFLIVSNEDNRYEYVINELKMLHSPGMQFSYGPSNYYVFGVLLARKLQQNGINQNPLEYLETEIFQKIGLEYESWSHDLVGNPNIPNGATLTPRNWVKFGQFMLNKGLWDNEQIIDSDFLEEMFQSAEPNTGHGYFCWLNTPGGYGFNENDSAPNGSTGGFIYHDGYTEIIGGLGAGKNRLYMIPSLDVVILRQTLLEEDTFEDSEFLELLLK